MPLDVVAVQVGPVSERCLAEAEIGAPLADDVGERVVYCARARHARSVSAA